MNDDELRAFLESATVGEDETESHAESETSQTTPVKPATNAGEQLPPTAPITHTPSAAAGTPPAAVPGNGRSFEDIVAARRAAGAAAPTTPIAATEPDLAPIVLPGPPASGQPLFNDPRRAAAPQPRQEPVPQHTAPLPSQQQQPQSPVAPQPNTAARLIAELGFDSVQEAPSGERPERSEQPPRPESDDSRRRFLPWVVTSIVAVVAIVASVMIVLAVKGNETPNDPTTPPTAEPSTPPVTPGEPGTEEPGTDPEPETPEAGDKPPKVEVGRTYNMTVSQWNVTTQVSNRLGSVYYEIDADQNLILRDGVLLPSFPASCKAMRTGFGMTRAADGKFEVLRPAEICKEAPELYNEVWGLVAALTDSAKAS